VSPERSRAQVLGSLAERILALPAGRPVRLAVDGRTASGKSTLARELLEAIEARGRPALVASLDGFHRPRAERYARGRLSAEGYYRDARDLEAVVRSLLAPLGPEGDRWFRTASFDLEADAPLDEPSQLAPPELVLLVDGTFLQRPELEAHFDAVLWVSTEPAECLRRGVARDAAALGGAERALEVYATRYVPAFELYCAQADPERSADAVLVNDDPARPALEIRPQGRLAG